MKNVIVGTSGHVDHGKTCLIKALSGVDTDRLKEEKKRGITIELGFANLPNDQDLHIGIIDVPGHEKFVRNMLAGIGGIDLVLLVIGLDEGVMPQTVEHFEILKQIGITKGIIVYTKSDIAESGMRELVDTDVDNLVRGSFLEKAVRIEVSAYTGQNIDKLKDLIYNYARQISAKRESKELFRLPIDRVFSMEGFGTVVTGTLLEGTVSANDEVEILPSGRIVKVRQVQSHNAHEQEAFAGQRTALNLAGVSKEELSRGEVIAYPNSVILSDRIDVSLTLFSTTKRKLKNSDHIHINYGSNQTECRVSLLDCQQITAGQSALAQLVFDSPIPVKRTDRFIIRFLSPVETFGGGTILSVGEKKHKRLDETVISDLKILRDGSDEEVFETEVLRNGLSLASLSYLARKCNFTLSDSDKILSSLYKDGKIIKITANKTYYIHKSKWVSVIDWANSTLENFHKKNEILAGIPKEQFRQNLQDCLHVSSSDCSDIILTALIEKKKVALVEGCIASVGFAASYSDENRTIKEDIEKIYIKAGIEVPETISVISSFKDQNLARQIINDLSKKGVLIKISNNYYIHRPFFDSVVEFLKEFFKTNKTLTLAQFRDHYKTSRKYALLVLEFCDYRGYTKLVGDSRIPLKSL